MSTENKEADNVGQEANTSHDKNQLRVLDYWRIDESLQGFENDGDTKSNQEDSVEECTKDLGA